MAYSCALWTTASVVTFLVIHVAEARYGGPEQWRRPAPAPVVPVAALVSEQLYGSLFLHKDNDACPAKGFYTYASFIQAARTFPMFAVTGDLSTRKR
jgi:hypothetical protein|uniref:chitinase n=1 Tax=Zea mays TaxID=4577 RepID=A0A804PTH1_MAIZE